jgi:hypothetical protein
MAIRDEKPTRVTEMHGGGTGCRVRVVCLYMGRISRVCRGPPGIPCSYANGPDVSVWIRYTPTRSASASAASAHGTHCKHLVIANRKFLSASLATAPAAPEPFASRNAPSTLTFRVFSTGRCHRWTRKGLLSAPSFFFSEIKVRQASTAQLIAAHISIGEFPCRRSFRDRQTDHMPHRIIVLSSSLQLLSSRSCDDHEPYLCGA